MNCRYTMYQRLFFYEGFFFFFFCINAWKISIFHMNIRVKWQDGTCDGENPWVGLSWANGTLFSQLWPCSIDSHGNTDEGPSTLYLPLLPLYPRSFYMEIYSICPGFEKWHPREMASSWRLCVEKPELMGQKHYLLQRRLLLFARTFI